MAAFTQAVVNVGRSGTRHSRDLLDMFSIYTGFEYGHSYYFSRPRHALNISPLICAFSEVPKPRFRLRLTTNRK
jgi:hypothetical protein